MRPILCALSLSSEVITPTSLFQGLHPDQISGPGQEHKRHLQVRHNRHGHRSSEECVHYSQDYYYWHQPEGLGAEIIIWIQKK